MRVSTTDQHPGRMFPEELSLGDDHFLLMWPKHFHIKDLHEVCLLTLFEFDQHGSVQLEWIKDKLNGFSAADDTFRPEFLETIVISHTSNCDLRITEEARMYLFEKGATVVTARQIGIDDMNPKSGPYHYSGEILRPLWKLYEDTHGAFLHTLVPDENNELLKLRTSGSVPQVLTVAVPPRIQRDGEDGKRPLQGWRIAIKDNFSIQNVRTSACNRAYYELYPAPLKSATCVQKLINAGAHVVGTTKLASFAATEEPMECIDWIAPWNPRADGYQSPAGSSSGSGVAIAAYPWLDIAVGSDTSGSGRRPGHWNGCFAMRPSHGNLSHEGLLKSFPRFDVPTFFGRDLDKCRVFAEAWYGDSLQACFNKSKPFSLLYALDYMATIGNQEQLNLIDAFVSDLEVTLEVQHERISFDEAWKSQPPLEAKDATLAEYMRDVSRDSFFFEDYHNFGPFREDYRHKFGKDPYISPPVRWQWELSSHITRQANVEALKRLEVYKDWFSKVVLKSELQNTLILIPIEEISPRYRDELPTKYFNPVGVPNLFLSPILKAPELTIPIGEYPYLSKVSGRVEKLPVAISMIAAHGHDFDLFDVALTCLRQSGRPTQVLAGNTLFPEP
ncbi:amidase signature enzyme [Cucurbitaria berberidis CBS 394.84]|uniref:Amidase signature enzyme n=1 Tax=Cucurbitaria berberidis CBS 394.84 TaxID=1168544 RepID=A0A9P4GTB2_9PLEO|nr:amidase signature enzyme [Cucurbitaria berberidis CBS 394.84]KAF1850932.1 amidase signature enzyme [Cucurbitaria berberidis CBS 394.84]